MILLTTRTKIRSVADRGKEQYCRGDRWCEAWRGRKPADVIYKRLAALDVETATAADVEEIIGNDSWTVIDCDECGERVPAVVRVGYDPDYESSMNSTALVCADCLRRALSMIEGE